LVITLLWKYWNAVAAFGKPSAGLACFRTDPTWLDVTTVAAATVVVVHVAVVAGLIVIQNAVVTVGRGWLSDVGDVAVSRAAARCDIDIAVSLHNVTVAVSNHGISWRRRRASDGQSDSKGKGKKADVLAGHGEV
jgi:hypothetical protein